MRVAVADPQLQALADALGHSTVELGPSGVDVVLLASADAWDRVRAWRAAGHTVPVVVHTTAAPALDRARLEPVVLLRQLDEDALAAALEAAGVGRPAGRVALQAGVADLDVRRFVRPDGTSDPLSPLECRFVGYLAARSGRAASREELQLQVWDHSRPLQTKAVDMLVTRLRRKIEPDPRRPVSLLTAPGGYRLLVRRGRPQVAAVDLVGRGDLLAELRTTLDDYGAVLLTGAPGVGKTALLRTLTTGDAVFVDAAVDALATIPVASGLLVVDHLDDRPELWPRLLAGHEGPLLGACRRVIEGGAVRTVPPLRPAAAEVLLRRLCERDGITLSAARIGEVLTGLDGLPLAIEQRAAELRTRASSGALLAEAVQASWNRLDEGAKALVAGLATVCGPVDFDVARQVCSADFAAWKRLVDGHLVVADGDGFRLIDALRRFAVTALSEVWEATLPAHARWTRLWAEALVGQLRTDQGREAAERLLARRDDLEQAWGTALDTADVELLPPLTLALDRVLGFVGERAGRRERIEEALSAVVDDPVAHARIDVVAALQDRHRDRLGARERLLAAVEWLWGDGDGVDAAVQAARLGYSVEGPDAVLDWLDGLDRSVLGRVELLLLDVRVLDLSDLAGRQTSEEVQRALLRTADDLAELGDLAGAVDAGVAAGIRMPVTGLGDPLRVTEQVVAWARQLPDDVVLGSALVARALRLGEALRTDEALRALDEADACFAVREPIRRWQVAHSRGIVLADGGRYDEARVVLEDYLEWCRSRVARVGIPDALLWLAGVECDAGRWRRAERHAREVLASADNPNHRLHAGLHLVLALAHLDPERARAVELEVSSGGPYEALRIGVLEHVLGGTDRDLKALAAEIPGAKGELVRGIVAEGLAGAIPEPTGMLSVRLLARSFAAAR